MYLLPRATLHSNSEQEEKETKTYYVNMLEGGGKEVREKMDSLPLPFMMEEE